MPGGKEKLKTAGSILFLAFWAGLWWNAFRTAEYGRDWRRIAAAFVCAVLSAVLLALLRKYRKAIVIRRCIFWGTAALGCAGILWAAIPYNGWLSWKVYDLQHQKKIDFVHTNLYEDGISGIFSDIRESVQLPVTLYISGAQNIDYTPDGTVTGISMMVTGTDADGNGKNFIISYDAGRDGRMTVEETEGSSETYKDTMLLEPLFDLSRAMDLKTESEAYASGNGEGTLQLVYWGYRSFDANAGTWWVSRDGEKSAALPGEKCLGYEISLHLAEGDSDPARYFADWMSAEDYEDPDQTAEDAHQAQLDGQRRDESLQGSSYTDPSDGSVYCYLSDSEGYRLAVVDAAAGSRFYQMQRTDNGGTTWYLQNEDPFGGQAGVATGMVFADLNYGYIGIGYASGNWAQDFVTTDGGITFAPVELPLEEVPEDAWHTSWSDTLTAEDYGYMQVPVLEGNTALIGLSTDASDAQEDWVVFESDDQGQTWTYAGKGMDHNG